MKSFLQRNSLKTLFLLLLLNSACGQYAQKKHTIDSEFLQLVDVFELEQNVTVDIDITFKKIERPAVGVCWYNKNNNKMNGLSIEIDPTFWNGASDDEREELLFHELGHCILGREHDETKLYLNIPKSIMYPYVFGWAYKKYRSYYVEELKNTNALLTNHLN